MARITVVCGVMGALATTLLRARLGHDVIVADRDPAIRPIQPDAEEPG